jgi:hypothetical protein
LKTPASNTIEASEADYLYTGQSQIPDSGQGLYTAIDIYSDEIIALFYGEVLTNGQAVKRIKAGKDQYFINLPEGKILDSMNVNCFAKYANDATGLVPSTFTNNARIALDENGNVCIEAIRNISANEELFCSYGKRYWKKQRGLQI